MAITVKQQYQALIEKHRIVSTRSKFLFLELLIPVVFFILSFYSDTAEGLWYLLIILSQFSILFSINNFIYQFIEEKGGKIKETLKIMGMKQISYDLSWFSILYIKAAAIFCITAIIPFALNNFDKNIANMFVCVLIYFFYYLAVIHQAFFYSVFFSNSRIGSYLYGVFFLAQGTLFLAGCNLNQINYDEGYRYCDTSINYYLSIFPQFAFSQAMSQNTFELYDGEEKYKPITKPYTYLLLLIADTFIYLVLYFYLNEIWPNDYGTQKSIFFPCKCKNRNISTNSQVIKQQLLENSRKSITLEPQEDYSNAVYHEKFNNLDNIAQTIRIKQLRKQFGSFAAVDGLDLCLYEQQIFCLLGHNGSGKTTTINLLTGMLPKSSGDVGMRGYDLDDNLEDIRQSLGLCSQKDILFDNLTVTEHLILMAKIKGVTEENIPQQLELMLEKCMLNTEKTKKASNLSGGNKRKLSLAMALIGDSKILLLDEPSSGLDPSSRKIIWDILKKVKSEKRTIILTTHHLEEAEELAERIGIMAKGKLLTVGTCNFIKKQFGIGFHLEILINKNTENSSLDVKNPQQLGNQQNDSLEQIRANIINTVQNVIEGSKFNKQSTTEMVKFILPFDKRDQFQELFRQLELYPNLSMNLQINSLEEAFVNIGMDEEKLLNKKQREEGLNEQEKQQLQIDTQDDSENFTNFDQIKVPQCLNKSPVFDFWSQTKAIFTKKMYMSYRSKSTLFGFIIPLIVFIINIISAAGIRIDKDDYRLDQEWYDIIYSPPLPLYQVQVYVLIGGIIFTYSLFMTTFGVSLVQERFQKQKYALNVMGCRVQPYWLGNFLFDLTVLFILDIFFVIFSFVTPLFGENLFNLNVVTKIFPSWIILLLFLNFTCITLSYLLQFRFEKTSSAQMALFWLTLIVFSGIPNAIVTPLSYDDNKWKYSALHFVFYLLSPFFILQDIAAVMIIHNQSSIELKYPPETQVYADRDYPKPEDCTLQLNYVWYYLPFLLVQGIIYAFIVIKLDLRKNNLKEEPNLNSIDDDLTQMENEVLEEQERLEDPDCEDIVKVTKLSKQYPNGFTAIRNNNFGVKKGEIFGLLGPNGSGKSTTFNILTSFIPKTDGSVKLKNIEVDKGIMDIYQNVGICPQFDCIWEQLSVYEHLRLYGMMKGLQKQDLDESIQYFLEVMQLIPYKKVKSGKLSGGNKRKLCVSLALIGGPDMQFFDEPSSGVDPIAKRFLWNSLTQNLKLRDAAITLTTHSMIEAESLSHKIGILINGRMQCYGTPDFLKKKYGEGYIISLETTKGQQNEVLAQITEQFPEVKQQVKENKDNNKQSEQNQDVVLQIDKQEQFKQEEENYQPATIVVKAPYDGFSFYKTFNFYDQLLENKQISDFSVSQSSLEKIFLELSKLQHTGEGENIGKKKKKK